MIDINDVIVIEEIKAFKAPDGTIHESTEKALKHTQDIYYENSIIELTKNIDPSEDRLLIRVFLKENRIKLKEIFERI